MDFLTFCSFISIEVLILFYYLGALLLPVAVWISGARLLRRFKIAQTAHRGAKAIAWRSLSRGQKWKVGGVFLVAFMFMELFWRIFFEFLIAYMQIRDALMAA